MEMSSGKSTKYLHSQTCTTKYIEWNTNNANQHKREDTRFIPGFSSPPRLAYVLVVEEATKALGLF